MAELHLYDFDGTLFRSPLEPDVWDGEWWNDVRSLMPPCIPDAPGPDWWISATVASARASIADPDVWAVMATGRGSQSALRYRVPELLRQKGLHFDEVFLAPPSGTLAWKRRIIMRLLRDHPIIDTLRVWDDRKSHLPVFRQAAVAMGVLPENVHLTEVRARSKAPECHGPDEFAVKPPEKGDRKPAYLGVFLSSPSRAKLVHEFPYLFHKAEAGHVTITKNVTPEMLARVGERVSLRVVGVAENDIVQAAVVSLPPDLKSDNRIPHITLSHAEGASPKDSNTMLATADIQPVRGFSLEGVIDVFPRSLVPSPSRVASEFLKGPVDRLSSRLGE